ncbi:MAG: hypothetical protein LBT00_03910 [Spirochaetaceae bacterium]|nr:hypothetical protein [Spirochaetaceae bacterium]
MGRPLRLDCFTLRVRNDDPLSLRASGTLPSEAIQGEGIPRLDCFTLRVRNDDPLSLRASGTLPGEAIQGEGIPRLDCFTLRVRNDDPLSLRASGTVPGEAIGSTLRVELVGRARRVILRRDSGALRGAYNPQHPASGFRAGAYSVMRPSVDAWGTPTKPCTAWFCPRRGGSVRPKVWSEGETSPF